MIDRLFNNTKILEKSLDASWLRNEAISQNIANVDTPNYKRQDVSFEQYLSQAMDAANPSGDSYTPVDKVDLSGIEPEITTDYSNLSMREDGNNVDIDSEMAALAKNSIKYNVLTQSLSSEYKRLMSAVTEGRK